MARRRRARRTRRPRGKQQTLLGPTFKTSHYSEPKAMNLKTGEIGRDYRARPRRSKGGAVNPRVGEPTSPGPGVSDEGCDWCGEKYDDWRSSCSWDEAASMLYDGRYDPDRPATQGKFYRSRGPILWRMHVCKLREWYQRHSICIELAEDLGKTRLDPPLFWKVAHGAGYLTDEDLASIPKRTRRKLEENAGWIKDTRRRRTTSLDPPPGYTHAEWQEELDRWEEESPEAAGEHQAPQDYEEWVF